MIHRQLNDEETRIFAAGMAAKRRGETYPKDRLSPEHYRIWKEGWRRVGRKNFGTRASEGSSRIEHGIHMIRTEVDNFDDALKIIAKQQRSAKASATATGRPARLKQQILLADGRSKQQKKRQKQKNELLPHANSVSEMERLLVERLMAATNMLTWSVNEMSNLAAINRFFPQITQHALIGIIGKLCRLLHQPMPDFSMGIVKAPQKTRRICMNCGADLRREDEKYCVHCAPPDERIKSVSDRRRKYDLNIKVLSDEAKSLGDVIHDAEEAIKNAEENLGIETKSESGDADYGRHPSKNTTGLEDGR